MDIDTIIAIILLSFAGLTAGYYLIDGYARRAATKSRQSRRKSAARRVCQAYAEGYVDGYNKAVKAAQPTNILDSEVIQ